MGSITTIEPAKLKVSTSRSLSNNLAGTVAGVLAVQRSGEPGYDNSTFWIRGISTFQKVGGDPLVLVDGIERELNNIDPEEIESFSVLKDAAASAVYGVRGANGVILINTKRTPSRHWMIFLMKRNCPRWRFRWICWIQGWMSLLF